MKPDVLITVNPGLIAGKRYQTVRSLVTALDKKCNLTIAPIDGYDFGDRKIAQYKRDRGGKFSLVKSARPQADVWIVYTDGYYLDHRRFGFVSRDDYFAAQIAFHSSALESGDVTRVINKPEAERKTLKRWLAKVDDAAIIPSYIFSSVDELHAMRRKFGVLVAKPDWGGGMDGVRKLASDRDVELLAADLERNGQSLQNFVFQKFEEGNEKRIWFLGDEPIAARVFRGERKNPWNKLPDDKGIEGFVAPDFGELGAHLPAAKRIWAKTGLEIGSVDFIGDRINEINGCGSLFTQYSGMRKIVDARPQLIEYVLRQVSK